MTIRLTTMTVLVAVLGTVIAIGLPGSPAIAEAAALPAGGQPEPAALSEPAGDRFVPLAAPALLLDTGWDGLGAGKTVTAPLGGKGGVPAGATAVSATVAVGRATANGSLRAWAAGEPVPHATTLHVFADQPWASAQAVIRLNAAGEASFFNNNPSSAVRVTVVADGYYVDIDEPAGLNLVSLAQHRILDTRQATPDRPAGQVAAGGTVTLKVAGQGGLPPASAIGAAVLTVTVVSPSAAGSWRPYPAGGEEGYGHGYFGAGRHKAQTLVTRLSGDGRLTLKNVSSGTAHYLAEVVGYYAVAGSTAAATRTVPVPPQRLLDTAAANGVPGSDPIPAGSAVTVNLGGRGDIPADGLSMVGLLLATRPATSGGYLTTFPDGGTRPQPASDVQYAAGRTGFNLVWARVSPDGKLRIYNGGGSAVHLWGDVVAYTLAATPPAPPARVVAAAGDTRATVSWQPPFDGGARIFRYTVTASPGGASATVTSGTSATVTGLTNGTAYTFRVTATNAAGTSAASAPSGEAIPAVPAPPGRPLVIDAFPRDSAARVSWSPPDTGAAGVTGYVVTADPGGASQQAPAEATETVVTGLANGTAYSFTVTAVNGNGAGPPSPPSTPVRPRPADPPIKPLVTTLLALDQRIDVQWAPAADSGAPITGYTVTAQPGDHTVQTGPGTTVASLTGLANGTAYTVSVVAANRAGASPPATADPVTPAAARPPAAPTDLHAGVVRDGAVQLTWTPPVDVGTAAITSYTVTASGKLDTRTVTTSATSATVAGLANGTYTFTVRATNAHGTGPASAATGAINPALTVLATPTVLSDAALASLRAVHDDGTLDFEQPPSQVAELAPGDFLVATGSPAAPRGLLRKVTDVRTASGLVVVSTEQAGLDKVLGEGAISFDERMSAADVQSFTPASPGVRVSEPMINGKTLRQGAPAARPGVSPQQAPLGLFDGEYTVDFQTELGHGGSVTAMLGLKPLLKTDVKLGTLGGIDTHVRVGAENRAEAGGVTVGMSGTFAGKWSTQVYPLGLIRGTCFNIQAGPVPVVICPEVKLSAKIAFDGEIGIRFSAEYARVIAGDAYAVGSTVTDFDFQNETLDTGSPGIDPYAEGDVKFGFGLSVVLYLYDTVGPGIEIGPYVQAVVDHQANPWWELRVGVEAAFILRFKIFKVIELTGSWTLADAYVVVRRAPGTGTWDGIEVSPQSSTLAVGDSVTLTATHNGASAPVEWLVIRGPGAVDQGGTFTSNEAGWTMVQAIPDDPDLLPAVATIWVGAVPSDPEPAVAPAPRALRVSWDAVTAGDEPVTGYAITTFPPTETTWVMAEEGKAAYQVYARGVEPGVAYFVQVSAQSRPFGSQSGWVGPVTPSQVINRIGSPTNIAEADNTGQAGSWGVALSGNGRYAFFTTEARSNLSPPEVYDPNSTFHYLLRMDLSTGEIVLASRLEDGHTPVPPSLDGWSASHDGNTVAYVVPDAYGDSGRDRILVHDIAGHTTWDASPGLDEPVRVGDPLLSGSGEVVIFQGVDIEVRKSWVWRTSQGGSPRNLVGCVGSLTECSLNGGYYRLSHDGNRVVFDIYSGDGGGTSVPVMWDSGQLVKLIPDQPLAEDHDDRISTPTISGDGTTLAITFTRDYRDGSSTEVSGPAVVPVTAGRIDLADLVASDRYKRGEPIILWAADLTADGRLLLYNRRESGDAYRGGDWAIANTVSRTSEPIPMTGAVSSLQLSEDGRVLAWKQDCTEELPCRPGVTPGPWVQRLG